ncbi:hypothetical protein AC792_09780 [Arthrobacter sp. RIT-PI-e]|uniref:MFS transporter n=1 Tax=Arthrobacter sp. RIT-PI-e TaxID=1681197 RepID=UPI0006760C49|nr:MFS transporter [Arthrobacter sp. RIT-PI-e]KNC18866.1 hypothetical protein AC792_09780 [Arthrobacter sp. RIT-PI-e]
MTWSIVVAHAVLVQVFTYAVRPGLSYAVIEAGGSAAILGLIGTAFALPALALALPAGRFTDRLGERTIALLGALLMVLSGVVALVFIDQVTGLLAAAFLLGLGHLLSVVSEQTVVANLSTEGKRESAFGLYTFAASTGQAAGPLLLALPHEASLGPNLSLVFLISLSVGVLLALTSAFMKSSPSAGTTTAQAGILSTSHALLRKRGVLRALIAGSLALASIDVTLAFWPALGTERALPAVIISTMLTVRAVMTMASRAALPLLIRTMSRKALLSTALLVSALGLGLTGLPVNSVLLITGAAIFGLAIGVCQPITMAWLTDVAEARHRGMAMSLRLAGNRVGQSTVPALVGVLAPATGVLGILIATAASLTLAAGITLRSPKAASEDTT